MASKRRSGLTPREEKVVGFLTVVGFFATAALVLLLGTPLLEAAYTTVTNYYWPPPITSFHYMVTVHEDGASGDITAAGTGSVGK